MKVSWSKQVVFLFFCTVIFIAKNTSAQTDISGIINDYTKVTALYTCNNYLTVASSAAFNPGDHVLLIQMQGATIDETQSATFGTITGMGNAGNYEFNEILSITGNDIYLKYSFLKTYTPTTGSVQLIRIPQYTNANIAGTLTAAPWNGSTGGVLVMEVSGNLNFSADIDVSGLGFRGGDAAYNPTIKNSSDCSTSSNSIYYYAFPSEQAGKKGEGIAAFITGKESGRGKNANGGGGGNSHNTGGAGGANYGIGGRGGDKTNSGCGCFLSFCPPNPYGLPSAGLASSYNNTDNRVFMGGGGGGGHQNNARGLPGANGAGIVIIKALSITGNNYNILAKGNSLDIFDPGDSGDGAGGGGAGGSVLLGVPTVSSLNVNVNGGKGGDTWYPVRDFGAGGGGGGGVTWTYASVFPTTDILSTEAAGANGISRTAGTGWGATPGSVGAKLSGLILPVANVVYTPLPPCTTVPVTLVNFTGEKTGSSVTLQWVTAMEINNSHFVIEKSTDGLHFTPIATIDGHGNSSTVLSYSTVDPSPVAGLNYYRLKQYDFDNTEHISGFIKVDYYSNPLVRKVYPNPFTNELYVEVPGISAKANAEVKLLSVLGMEVTLSSGIELQDATIVLNTTDLAKGVYFLQLIYEGNTEIVKVVKE